MFDLMIIQNADISDASELLKLQKLAYLSEALIYNNYGIPPLIQTLEEVEDKFEDHIYLKAVNDKRIIGSVRGNVLDSESVYIARLIVHPDYQNQGIGAKLIEDIEMSYPDFNRFELVTGYKSRKNIYFYQKMGYKIFKKELCPSGVYLLYLEKIIL
ncbi:MAG: GNAT family N-acetyltransferase [Methanobacterium sp.]